MIKDLMVHLDGSKEDDVRLAHAQALASRFIDTRITGLYTNALPEYAYVLGAQSGFGDLGPMIELEAQLRQEGDRIVGELQERLSLPGASHEVRRLDAWPSLIPRLVASQARWADIFVASTPYRDTETQAWNQLVETVLFEGAHGLYLVPPGCPVRPDLRSILLAWKDTTEAARAVAEALPFLKLATRVRLLFVDTSGLGQRAERAADIAAHLDRHEVKIEILAVESDDSRVGEIVSSEAAKMSADLTVMGAYGHSRLREWMLGGATRDLISRSTLPILMAH